VFSGYFPDKVFVIQNGLCVSPSYYQYSGNFKNHACLPECSCSQAGDYPATAGQAAKTPQKCAGQAAIPIAIGMIANDL